MKVININSNNPNYVKDLVIRFLIINQVNYLDIEYEDYCEVHFNDTIFRIRYSLVNCNDQVILQSIADIRAEQAQKLASSVINVQPEVKKKVKFPKPKKQNFQLTKKKNKFIYERNSRFNRKSYRRF